MADVLIGALTLGGGGLLTLAVAADDVVAGLTCFTSCVGRTTTDRDMPSCGGGDEDGRQTPLTMAPGGTVAVELSDWFSEGELPQAQAGTLTSSKIDENESCDGPEAAHLWDCVG